MEMKLEDVRLKLINSGYKTSHVAEQIGVDTSTVSRFKSGKANLGKPAMILLFQLLNLDPRPLRKKAS